MSKVIDLVGRRFGNLVVLERAPDVFSGKQRVARWLVRCDRVQYDGSVCGKQKVVWGRSMTGGGTKSCGCGEGYWKHGAGRRGQTTPEFEAWEAMKQRCREGGAYYGRFVYCEGFDDFNVFVEKLGLMTAPTLDRIRNEEGYYCGDCTQCVRRGWKFNCRWATRLEQALNRSDNHKLYFEGREMCLSEWEHEYNLTSGVLYHRLEDLGWPIADALKIPAGRARRSSRRRTRWSSE